MRGSDRESRGPGTAGPFFFFPFRRAAAAAMFTAMHRLALAALLVALAGCAGGGIKVIRTTDEKFAARPADCPLEFLQKAPRDRAFTEIAELESHVTNPPIGGMGALEVLRPQACELGADAVVVTRNFVTNEFGHVLVAGTAIKFKDEPPAPPPPAPEGATTL